MSARDIAVAAEVVAAQARADALPGTLYRCRECGKPAAECADSNCLTTCPEHRVPVPLVPLRGRMACTRSRCPYEVQARGDVLAALLGVPA